MALTRKPTARGAIVVSDGDYASKCVVRWLRYYYYYYYYESLLDCYITLVLLS